MVPSRSPFTSISVLTAVLLTSGVASATDGMPQPKRERALPYRAVEAQALVITQLLPRATYGLEGAYVLGWPSFQVRVGGMFAGSPGFHLGRGEIANMLAIAIADICVARNVTKHQIRMCAGGQGGSMIHRWIGYERPGRDATPWAAGTLRGDYRIGLTDHVGLIGGAGVIVPMVGPSFRAYGDLGLPSPIVFPGPVGGFVSLGTSVRW
jgi:hypothetical protein